MGRMRHGINDIPRRDTPGMVVSSQKRLTGQLTCLLHNLLILGTVIQYTDSFCFIRCWGFLTSSSRGLAFSWMLR